MRPVVIISKGIWNAELYFVVYKIPHKYRILDCRLICLLCFDLFHHRAMVLGLIATLLYTHSFSRWNLPVVLLLYFFLVLYPDGKTRMCYCFMKCRFCHQSPFSLRAFLRLPTDLEKATVVCVCVGCVGIHLWTWACIATAQDKTLSCLNNILEWQCVFPLRCYCGNLYIYDGQSETYDVVFCSTHLYFSVRFALHVNINGDVSLFTVIHVVI